MQSRSTVYQRTSQNNSFKNTSFIHAFRHAVRGFVTAMLYEANVRRQLLILTFALVLAVWLQISTVQLAIVLLAAVPVLVVELMNSSIEALADAVHPDYNEHIHRAKDMAAAGVLLASFAALVVGMAIFLPPLLARLHESGIG